MTESHALLSGNIDVHEPLQKPKTRYQWQWLCLSSSKTLFCTDYIVYHLCYVTQFICIFYIHTLYIHTHTYMYIYIYIYIYIFFLFYIIYITS